jgi:hypothetical protein
MIPQYDGAGDEKWASGLVGDEKPASGSVGESDDKMEVDGDVGMKADHDGEAVKRAQDAAAVHDGESEVDKEQTQLDESAWWDGGGKKPSLMSRVLKRTQSKMALKGKDKEVRKRGSVMDLTFRLARFKVSFSIARVHPQQG